MPRDTIFDFMLTNGLTLYEANDGAGGAGDTGDTGDTT